MFLKVDLRANQLRSFGDRFTVLKTNLHEIVQTGRWRFTRFT